jgi:hypothetical protein
VSGRNQPVSGWWWPWRSLYLFAEYRSQLFGRFPFWLLNGLPKIALPTLRSLTLDASRRKNIERRQVVNDYAWIAISSMGFKTGGISGFLIR